MDSRIGVCEVKTRPSIPWKILHQCSPAERFWLYVYKTPGCWLWLGKRNRQGYGHFTPDATKSRGTVNAHRFAYECLVGPIPAGMELDHLCRVEACVRPEHLEPVSHSENVRRGLTVQRRLRKLARGICDRGHDLNQFWNYKFKRCWICHRESARASMTRWREKQQLKESLK